ncbi:MAG: OB-fold domain-containing protein [Proteobacteria bacterium]|nr:OB-fold domain-containing protein [Pseudomonadota bacterium]
MLYRDQESNIRLYARKCQECGKVIFLRDIHVCPDCYSRDMYSSLKLSKDAVLFTFNQEYYYPSPDSPTTMAIVDFQEGARITTQMTDTDPSEVTVDMPVEMCFRKYHEGNFFHNYFWKCRSKSSQQHFSGR